MAVLKRVSFKTPPSALAKDGRFQKELKRVAKTVMELGLELVRGDIAKNAPVDQGTLANSVQTEAQVKGDKVLGDISMVPYAKYVEEGFGGSGSFPDVDAIFAWVKRKNLDFKGGKKAKEKVSKNKLTRQAKLAFIIARNIANEKVEGKLFIEKAVVAAQPKIDKLLVNSIRKLEAKLKNERGK